MALLDDSEGQNFLNDITVDSPIGFESVITGNIEILNQGINLLESLGKKSYCQSAMPVMQSTIGEHFRHILDMFHSLKNAFYFSEEDTPVMPVISEVDYNFRRRGHCVESCCDAGISELTNIIDWHHTLLKYIDISFKQKLRVLSEVSIHQCNSVALESTLLRELIFVSTHAVHHYAMIKIIANILDFEVDNEFGLAPATASFIRKDS